MAKNPVEQGRAYLVKFPAATRRVLRQMRAIIRETVPGAVEHFSYGIPGFKYDGKPLVWYAGFKEHASLYPITGAIQRANAKSLKGYETSKGTVRFPLSQPLPATLVKRLVRARLAEIRPRG